MSQIDPTDDLGFAGDVPYLECAARVRADCSWSKDASFDTFAHYALAEWRHPDVA